MQLNQALEQIAEIRAHLSRTETFRGYRSLTIGFTGVVGIGAAILQAVYIPAPVQQIENYLTLWLAAALLNLSVVSAEMAYRWRRAASPGTTRLTRIALEQFVPCLVAGAAVTAVLAFDPESVWLLPGLWAILFSLGVFASYRLLPRAVFAVGVYYLVAGSLCLTFGRGEYALSPWLMGISFGGGQLLTAFALYWTLERRHER